MSGLLIVNGDEYPMPDELTHREWGIVKRMSGVLPATFKRSILDGDMELHAALAVIVKRRAGEDVDEDAILDMPAGSIEGKQEPPLPPEQAAAADEASSAAAETTETTE